MSAELLLDAKMLQRLRFMADKRGFRGIVVNEDKKYVGLYRGIVDGVIHQTEPHLDFCSAFDDMMERTMESDLPKED